MTDDQINELLHTLVHCSTDAGRRIAIRNALAAATTKAAPQQEPVAWRHSKTLRLYETKAEVPLADGDERAEPLCLAAQHPAPVAQGDAEDAARYRWLRARWGRIADEYDGDSDQLVAIRESDSHFEGWDVDPASLDRAIDAARAQAKKGGAA